MDPRREDWWLINRGDAKDFTGTCYIVTLHHGVDEVDAGIDILLRVLCDSNSVQATPKVSKSSMIS